MPASYLDRLRRLCLGFPDAHEVIAWGEPTFRIKNKQFAMYAAAGNHHGDGRPAVWIRSTLENQAFLLRAHPKRLFKPAYVGPFGWVAANLDDPPAWKLLPDLLLEGYQLAAAKKPRPPRPSARRSTRTTAKSGTPTKPKSPRRAKSPRRPSRP